MSFLTRSSLNPKVETTKALLPPLLSLFVVASLFPQAVINNVAATNVPKITRFFIFKSSSKMVFIFLK